MKFTNVIRFENNITWHCFKKIHNILGFENFRNDIKTFESKLSKLKEGSSKKLVKANWNASVSYIL